PRAPAWEPAGAPRPPPWPKRGRALQERLSWTCHGADGDAGTPRAREYTPRPANFREPAVSDALSPAKVFRAVRFGVPNTAMAPFDFLSEAERWDLSFYVVGLGHFAEGTAVREARFFTLGDLSVRSNAELSGDLRSAGLDDARVAA